MSSSVAVSAQRTTLAVLVCAHNRRDKSLACLARLRAAERPDGVEILTYFVDDGSTDGTADAVAGQFPEVQLVHGDGGLYWSGGIRAAWAAAAQHGHDFYLWLNDDVELATGAIASLVGASASLSHGAIICGSVTSPGTGHVTYGGRNGLEAPPLAPNGTLQPCGFINGNVVLVPKPVFEQLGMIDSAFVHDIGDYDYGLRALAAGIPCYVAPEAVGTCDKNEFVHKWRLPTVPLRERFRLLYSPLGRPNPLNYFRFAHRHFGLLAALRSFVMVNLRALRAGWRWSN